MERIVECMIDSATMYMFKMEKLKKTLEEYVYEDRVPGVMQNEIETISVRFDVEYPYQIFSLLDWYWGGDSAPDAKTMETKAKEWYEKYGAELIKISHTTLSFVYKKKISEKEAKELMEEVEKLCAEIIDCESEKRLEHLMKKGCFTLWWD